MNALNLSVKSIHGSTASYVRRNTRTPTHLETRITKELNAMSIGSLHTRHTKIAIWSVSGLAIGLALFIAVSGLLRLAASFSNNDAVRDWERQQTANEFWLVVAGEAPVDGVEPQDDLAARLHRDVIMTIEDSSSITNDSFSGPPRVYRGVTEELGFAPFDNQCGNECGLLTNEMVSKLQFVKDGQVADLIVSEPRPVDTSSFGLIPLLPFPLELVLIWQVAGAIGLYFGLRMYSDPRMTWVAGDGKYDTQQYLCYAASPLGMFTYLRWINRKRLEEVRREQEEILRNMGLSSHLKDVNAAIEQIERLPAETRNTESVQKSLAELRALRDEILEEPYLVMQRERGLTVGRNAADAERVAANLRERVDSTRRIHEEAMQEVGDWH